MILQPPEKVENVVCKALPEDPELIKEIIDGNTISQMMVLMNQHGGIGLAAPQVGIKKRFFLAFLPEKGRMRLFINPSYEPAESASDSKIDSEEGCVTYPKENLYIINRHSTINVKYLIFDAGGLRWMKETLDDIDAVVFQHEVDHLNGKTIAMLGKLVEK